MNATERGLLTAVVREPDDDTGRLVYADWLDARGPAGDWWLDRTGEVTDT